MLSQLKVVVCETSKVKGDKTIDIDVCHNTCTKKTTDYYDSNYSNDKINYRNFK